MTRTDKGLFPATRIPRLATLRPPAKEEGAWHWGHQLIGEHDQEEGSSLDSIGDAIEAAIETIDSWLGAATPGATPLTQNEAVEILAGIRDGLWRHGAVRFSGQLVGDHRGEVLCWVAHRGFGAWAAPARLLFDRP